MIIHNICLQVIHFIFKMTFFLHFITITGRKCLLMVCSACCNSLIVNSLIIIKTSVGFFTLSHGSYEGNILHSFSFPLFKIILKSSRIDKHNSWKRLQQEMKPSLYSVVFNYVPLWSQRLLSVFSMCFRVCSNATAPNMVAWQTKVCRY